MSAPEPVQIDYATLKARFEQLRDECRKKATRAAGKRAYHYATEYSLRCDTWVKAIEELNKLKNELTTQQ